MMKELDDRLQALTARGALGPETTDRAPAVRLLLTRMAERMESGLPISAEPMARGTPKQGEPWTLRLGDALQKRLINLQHDHPIGRAAGSFTEFVKDLLRYGLPTEEALLEGRLVAPPSSASADRAAPEEDAGGLPTPAEPIVADTPAPLAPAPTGNAPPLGPATCPAPTPRPGPFDGLVLRFTTEPAENTAGDGRGPSIPPPRVPTTLESLSTDQALGQFIQAELELLTAGLGETPPEKAAELVEPLRSMVDGFKAILALQDASTPKKPTKRRR